MDAQRSFSELDDDARSPDAQFTMRDMYDMKEDRSREHETLHRRRGSRSSMSGRSVAAAHDNMQDVNQLEKEFAWYATHKQRIGSGGAATVGSGRAATDTIHDIMIDTFESRYIDNDDGDLEEDDLAELDQSSSSSSPGISITPTMLHSVLNFYHASDFRYHFFQGIMIVSITIFFLVTLWVVPSPGSCFSRFDIDHLQQTHQVYVQQLIDARRIGCGSDTQSSSITVHDQWTRLGDDGHFITDSNTWTPVQWCIVWQDLFHTSRNMSFTSTHPHADARDSIITFYPPPSTTTSSTTRVNLLFFSLMDFFLSQYSLSNAQEPVPWIRWKDATDATALHLRSILRFETTTGRALAVVTQAVEWMTTQRLLWLDFWNQHRNQRNADCTMASVETCLMYDTLDVWSRELMQPFFPWIIALMTHGNNTRDAAVIRRSAHPIVYSVIKHHVVRQLRIWLELQQLSVLLQRTSIVNDPVFDVSRVEMMLHPLHPPTNMHMQQRLHAINFTTATPFLYFSKQQVESIVVLLSHNTTLLPHAHMQPNVGFNESWIAVCLQHVDGDDDDAVAASCDHMVQRLYALSMLHAFTEMNENAETFSLNEWGGSDGSAHAPTHRTTIDTMMRRLIVNVPDLMQFRCETKRLQTNISAFCTTVVNIFS